MFPLGVTFVPASSKNPIRYLVTLNKQDKVIKLKEQLIKCVGQDAPKNIALAEVLDSHIARILVSWNCWVVKVSYVCAGSWSCREACF
jgi:ABC-type metal ion transport system substrate-binding protein